MTEAAEKGGAGRPRRRWWRIVLAVLSLPVLWFVWICGMAVILFGSLHPGLYSLLWTVFSGALGTVILAALFIGRRTVVAGAVVAVLCVGVIASVELWRYWSVTRFRQLSDEIDWYSYRPFIPRSRAVKVAADPRFRMTGKVPRASAAYALFPLCSGVAHALYPPREYGFDELEAYGSDRIYTDLLDGNFELIFALPPSAKQLEEAKKRGLAYEVTPFAREAFVFFVNKRNPASGLTQQQIRAVYSGRVSRWEELGAGEGRILAFQRNEGSGSQTMLQRIMGDTPLMAPLREDRLGGMGGIINDVADYRNHPGALGFSFRFFASEMFRSDEIKFLTVDGVAPTRENIRNGSYPFVTDCCVVTVRPRDENIRRIVDFLRSPAGCEMIEKTGYTPLAAPAAAAPGDIAPNRRPEPGTTAAPVRGREK